MIICLIQILSLVRIINNQKLTNLLSKENEEIETGLSQIYLKNSFDGIFI